MALVVEFASLRSNLVNLPHSVASSIFSVNIPAQKVIVELEYTDSKATKGPSNRTSSHVYLGWTGLYSTNENSIEIDPAIAKNIGINHKDKVKLNIKTSAPTAHVVHLEPLTTDDWTIVESNAAFLENYMINQLRSVSVSQPVTVFPSSTLMANLKVTKIEPSTDSFAFLGSTSEVIVAPKTKNQASKANESLKPSESSTSSQTRPSTFARCTGYPYAHNCNTRELQIRGTLPFEDQSKVIVSLALPSLLSPEHQDEQEVSPLRNIMATYIHDPEMTNISGLSYGLTLALGLNEENSVGVKALVRQVQNTAFQNLPQLILRPYSFNTYTKSVTSKPVHLTQEQFSKLGILVGCKGLIIPPIDSDFLPHGGILDSESPETSWGTIKEIVQGTETPLAESKAMPKLTEISEKQVTRPVVGQEALCASIVDDVLGGSGILLYGSRGCGKSVLINEVIGCLKRQYVHPVHFKCSLYTDKGLPLIREALKKASYEASWYAPSVVIFDDIDKMIPNQQENSGDSDRQRRVAEIFVSIWRPLIESGRVSILATAQDQSSVHGHIITSHLLESIRKLRSPNKTLREAILNSAIDHASIEKSSGFDILEVVDETEGYQPGDLWILIDRVATNLALSDGDAIVDNKTILDAKSDYTPASLRGVKLEKPTTKWADVGGLKDVKRVILETLEWPTKYAPVFANCPLRLRSGLLLYGYPGCGKTMLAGAIASQTGLNFISVKGPEILNKYIGASEQSVRDLFDRAQAAKPCVLFFDEFDSIAPKRGHDATGVTDRVVNQLLTQMDGAEGLDGVYVLAATSRPDMIDSALLRPGRLDKTLLCDMPNVDDRHDIILRATKTMNLNEDVDLFGVAEKTAGFTGADLQALVYNAYLEAVHKSLEASESSNENSEQNSQHTDDRNAFQLGDKKIGLEGALNYVSVIDENSLSGDKAISKNTKNDGVPNVVVTNEDVSASLKVSKSSISDKEIARFRDIYSSFSNDRNGEMPPGTSSNEIGGRVTLQ